MAYYERLSVHFNGCTTSSVFLVATLFRHGHYSRSSKSIKLFTSNKNPNLALTVSSVLLSRSILICAANYGERSVMIAAIDTRMAQRVAVVPIAQGRVQK